MHINFSVETSNVSATDAAILIAVGELLNGDLLSSEETPEGEQATGTTAAPRKRASRAKGQTNNEAGQALAQSIATADTATNELGNAAGPMETATAPPPAQTQTASPTGVTLDELRKIAGPIAENVAGNGPAKFAEVLAKHGAAKLSTVPKESYEALKADLVAIANQLDALG